MSSKSKPSKRKVVDLDLQISFLRRLNQIRTRMFQIRNVDEFHQFLKEDLLTTCQMRSFSMGGQVSSSLKKGVLCFSLVESEEYFIRFYKDSSFNLEEKKFLTHVTQTLSAVLKRIEKNNQYKLLKDQWKNTLNSIQKPICLTNHNFSILSSNEAFLKIAQQPKHKIFKKNCLNVFFGSPLSFKEMQKLEKSKILKSNKGSIFEIHSINLLKEEQIRLLVFLDVSQKLKMEEEISNLKELAELGIIASSIAHDLNNPLAGILALLNICQKKHPHIQVEEMLESVRRCQSLVSQLLNSNSSLDQLFADQKDKSLEGFLDSL